MTLELSVSTVMTYMTLHQTDNCFTCLEVSHFWTRVSPIEFGYVIFLGSYSLSDSIAPDLCSTCYVSVDEVSPSLCAKWHRYGKGSLRSVRGLEILLVKGTRVSHRPCIQGGQAFSGRMIESPYQQLWRVQCLQVGCCPLGHTHTLTDFYQI